MNIQDESQKFGGNIFFRYALLAIGFLTFTFGEGILTWKQTAVEDAAGDIDSIELQVAELIQEIEDTKDADEKKDLREEIKELEDKDLAEARLDAQDARAASKNGVWFFSMISVLGSVVMGLGLIIIAIFGSSHEKVGALVTLGLIIIKM